MNYQKPLHITAIVAMSQNRVIGNQHGLPWHLPEDLKHFKALTTGHVVLMGRKTYESIGKPLPNRINIVLTQDKQFKASNIIIHHTKTSALCDAAHYSDKKLFIIGGAEIYHLFLEDIQYIEMTLIHHILAGDTYFPALDLENWEEITRIDHDADDSHAYDYSFISLRKKAGTIHMK